MELTSMSTKLSVFLLFCNILVRRLCAVYALWLYLVWVLITELGLMINNDSVWCMWQEVNFP